MGPKLNFKPTSHDRCIYSTLYKGVKVYLLRQVDDFAIATPNEEFAKEIFAIIGKEMQFKSEKRPPFEYLGLLSDYNGVKVEQTSTNIAIHGYGLYCSCASNA